MPLLKIELAILTFIRASTVRYAFSKVFFIMAYVFIRADQFDVSLPFLLQQAAWLYERQLSQVREQLRRVNRPTSSGVSPTPSSITGSGMAGGQPMRRGGSGGKLIRVYNPNSVHIDILGSRVPSSLSFRARDSPIIKAEEGVPGTPVQTKGMLLHLID